MEKKYIDSEKLIAEIERQKKSIDECPFIEAEFGAEMKREGKVQAYNEILSFITSLQQEQPEVDLEKELDQWRHKHFKGKRDDDYNGEYLERESQLDLAHYFYELGLNAKKGE